MNKSCIIAQSGGPTAVINCTLLGIVEEAKRMGFEHIYGALNGIEGVLNHRIVELTNQTHEQLQLLMSTPGAALGSGRHQLKNAEEDPEVGMGDGRSVFRRAVWNLPPCQLAFGCPWNGELGD